MSERESGGWVDGGVVRHKYMQRIICFWGEVGYNGIPCWHTEKIDKTTNTDDIKSGFLLFFCPPHIGMVFF